METLFVALRVLLSLGAVLALLWILQRRFARGGAGTQPAKRRAANTLAVVGRHGVGNKASVVVVEYGDKYFLLGVSESTVTLLHSDEAIAPPPAVEEVATRSTVEPIDTAHAIDDDFAAFLAEAGLEQADVGPSTTVHTSRAAARIAASPSKLSGSILDRETWKQAAAFVRNGR